MTTRHQTRPRARRRALLAALALAGSTAVAPAADWRAETGTFRIGMVGTGGERPFVPGLATLHSLYARTLGIPVEVLAARDYPALVAAVQEGRVDYAILSTAAYAAAWAGCGCVRPLVAPVNADGSAALRSVLVAARRTEAGEAIRTALGPADSLGARLVPLAALGSGELTPHALDLVDAPSQADAEAMLADGRVAALFGWAYDDPRAPGGASGGSLARLRSRAASLDLVWKSPPYGFGPHVVRADLDPEAASLLSAMLTGLLDRDPEAYALLDRHHGGGFRAVGPRDYAAVVEALEALRDSRR